MANLILPRLTRTLSTFFRFGTIRLKDASGILSIRNAEDTADTGIVASTIKLTSTPGNGKVLTSDADGLGSWQTPEAGAGDMLQSVYDTDTDGIVDNAEALEGHAASYFATAGHDHNATYFQKSEYIASSAGAGDAGKPVKLDGSGKLDSSFLPPAGSGDMTKAVYDTDNDNVVESADNADTVDGQHASAFATSGHNHDAAYAALGHNHDGSYAVLSHTHDDRYFTESEHIDTSAGAGDAGKPIKLNASGKVDDTMLPAGQATDFLALTDTPDSYSGQGGKVVAVNVGATALEFVNAPSASVTLQALFYVSGDLTVAGSPLRIYNATGTSKTISKVFIAVDTAPVGAAVIVDVHKDGTTIFTTQSNRPQIAAGANTGESTTIEVATWAAGEYLTAFVDQVGSSTAGKNLVIHVVYS